MDTKSVLYNYLNQNKKSFLIIVGTLFIGMVLGIILINHTSNEEMLKINSYVNGLIKNVENIDNINKTKVFFQSVKQNVSFAFIVWLLGCTIMGSVLVHLAVFYKGFSLRIYNFIYNSSVRC